MMRKSSDLLEQILTRGPSQGTILLVLTAMKEEGRIGLVIQGCLKALDIYPDDIRLRKLLAESYHEAGFIGQAEAELAKVTSEIDDLASAYKLQARIYARQQRLKESFESLKRYLAHNPDDQEGLDLLDKIRSAEAEAALKIESPAEVAESGPEIEPLTEMHEAKPEKEPAQTVIDLATPTLAELYYSQGQLMEAIATYEKVLFNKPDDIASAERLAQLRASMSQEPEPALSNEDVARAKTEKTIKILETWLTRIQAVGHSRMASNN